ncbi:MAG: hypothetical protein A2381_11445 [Bdellovibrionales bacterium RIFOXYB1_FULL_37_110]|nr:MAG: hypothetical protein A2417_11750 [Bdellovibrionales bacterium RIFOXYC1_FULL_37_79]OFZ57307.1 MAG: hypothetical protein A2381_11445 [Bdellovibrionales bacterium RIFOXYB1_FULL_37_110]OFZ62203.1 MAG: hypothetical protein A2577_13995 [Bdellovibrionales bacterium RIFOXYD1_FULL_36_51]
MLGIFYSSKDPEKFGKNCGEEKRTIPYVQLVIVLIGLGASFWTYLLHLQLKAQLGSPLICDVNETLNCSKIIGSAQGEFFNIPLGIWGMSYWLIGLSLVYFLKFSQASFRYIVFWRMLVSSVGFLFALVLIYISYFILNGICEFCSVVQACCILYFIASFISYKRMDKNSVYYALSLDFYKLVGSVVIAFIIPLMIFAATNTFLYEYYKKNIEQNSASKEGPIASQTSVLPLPFLDNEDVDFSLGDDNAPVDLIEFTDFECPFCQLLHEKLQELKPLIDKGMIKIYFRNWPLSYHQYATTLAIAARCAGWQNKFWEFANWSFKTAKQFAEDPKKKEKAFSDHGIISQAKLIKLNLVDFEACLQDPKMLAKIKKDSSDAALLGGEGTPFLLVNGIQYEGDWLNPDELKNDILKIINKKRKK